jgi:hypothetical protein
MMEICQQEVSGFVQYLGAAARMPAYEGVATTKYRNRHANIFLVPSSWPNMVVLPAHRRTMSGQSLLMHCGPGNNFLLFARAEDLARLCNCLSAAVTRNYILGWHVRHGSKIVRTNLLLICILS